MAARREILSLGLLGDEKLGCNIQESRAVDQLEIGQQHQRCENDGEDDAQQCRQAGASNQTPTLLLLRQAAARHGDDDGVVAGQQDINENDLADGQPKCRVTELIDPGRKPGAPQRRIKIFDDRSHGPQPQPTISLPAKNCAISLTAVSGASEPCTEFSPIELACTLRMVPGAALAGSVAPMMSR